MQYTNIKINIYALNIFFLDIIIILDFKIGLKMYVIVFNYRKQYNVSDTKTIN